MRIIMLMLWLTISLAARAQRSIVDESIRFQQERMVFKQWGRNKFTPTSGFLGLNPYYWLTWGLHPNYPKTDLRPLSATGPQTQRLAMVAAMNSSSRSYKLHSDTLRNIALLEVAAQNGLLSGTDPLWILYYRDEFRPVLENTAGSILSPFPLAVRAKLVEQGLFSWYKNELDKLKERIEGARTADMDRGSRIMAYHRMLQEYQKLQANWEARSGTAQVNMERMKKQDKLKAGDVQIDSWTEDSDVRIAKKILADRKH
ncbi:MAG: hypothetical protein EOO90_06300 [Pedobacter sp.]|nr:MAG: hypothetical protein EOO90_06300 [Pedobacter sp.]